MPLFDFECRLSASQPAEAETDGTQSPAGKHEPAALQRHPASFPQQEVRDPLPAKGSAGFENLAQERSFGHFRWPLDSQALQRFTATAPDAQTAEPNSAQGLSAQQAGEQALGAGSAANAGEGNRESTSGRFERRGDSGEGSLVSQDLRADPESHGPANTTCSAGLEHTLLAAFAAVVYRYDPTRSEATVAVCGSRQGAFLEPGLRGSSSSDARSESISSSDGASDSGIQSRSSSTSSSSSEGIAGATLRPVVFHFDCESGPGEASKAVSFGDVLQQSLNQWPRPVHVSFPPIGTPAIANSSAEVCAADAAFLVVHPSDASPEQPLEQVLPRSPYASGELRTHPCCASSAHEPLAWAGETGREEEREENASLPGLVLRILLPDVGSEDAAATKACPAPVEAVLSYDTAVFDGAFIERMGVHYSALLASLSLLPSSSITSTALRGAATVASSAGTLGGGREAGLPSGMEGVSGVSREAVPLSALQMLSCGEVQHVQTELSGSLFQNALGPSDENLTDMIERQAAEQPDAMAIVDNAISLTYSQLRSLARSVAYCLLTQPGLRNSELAPGTPEAVGLGMERGVEWVVSLLGVLYAGMAYVPLDPALPDARLRHIVESAELQTVLTTASCRARFQWVQEVSTGAQSLPVCLLPVSQALAYTCGRQGDASQQEEEVGRVLGAAKAQGSDPCYILFTSGSTGQPKGVVVLHQGVLNMCHAFREVLVGSAPDVRAQMAAMTFDLHAMELFLAFDTGAAVAVCTKEELLTDLGGFIRRRGVRGLVLTPTVGSLLDPENLPSLEWLAFGGEILPRALARRWTKAGCTVVDHYGPTEVSIAATGQVWRPGSQVEDHIGHPLRGAHLYVLGPQQELLPVGVPGEICIAGVHVSQGYMKRPDLTSRAYLPNPFRVGEHDSVLYRTGDRGRWLPSGRLQFLGRIDFQIKLRGLRVEPGEIENHISRVRGVARCVVVMRRTDAGADFLAAYIMPSPTSQDAGEGPGSREEGVPLVQRVRRALEAQVPDYMVPSALVLMDKLPLTSSGKVDRKLLPKPTAADFVAGPGRAILPNEQAAANSGAQGEGLGRVGGGEGEEGAPSRAGAGAGQRSEEEVETSRMCALFAEILGLDSSMVHPGSNFFHLGGNSLTAAHLVSRLRELPGAHGPSAVARGTLTIRTFFQNPTPNATAAALARGRRPEGGFTPGLLQDQGADKRVGGIGGEAGPAGGTGVGGGELQADEQQRQLVHEFVMHRRQQKALLYQHSLGQAYAMKQQRQQQQQQGQQRPQPLLSLLPPSLLQSLRLGPTQGPSSSAKPSLGTGPSRPSKGGAGSTRILGSRAVHPSEALPGGAEEAALKDGGLVGSATGVPAQAGSGVVPKIRRPQVLPLSHAQEMIWLVQHVIPQPQVLYPCDVWRVEGDLDVARVEKAFEILIRRHQALRLRYNSDTSPSARLMSAMLHWWGPGGSQVASSDSLNPFIPPTATARVHPDAGARAGPPLASGFLGRIPGAGAGVSSTPSSSSPLSSTDSSPDGTPRAYQGGQAAPRPAAAGVGGAVIPALTSSVIGLVGPAFVKNLHSIFRSVNQQDLDPALRPFRVEVEDLQGVTDDQERTFLVAMALRRACRPLTGKASPVAEAPGSEASSEGQARAGSGAGAGAGEAVVKGERSEAFEYLFRVTVVRTGDGQSLLVCLFNHLIFDGISSAVLYREFPHVYATLSADGLPEVASYAEYVAWEDAHLEAGAREKELSFWRECLGRDPPSLQLAPAPAPGGSLGRKPGVQTGALPCRGGWVDFSVSAPLRYAIEALASKQGATLNMAMLAAYHAMLHAWTGQREVITGMLVARRFLPAHQNMLGHCADLAPVLTALASSGDQAGWGVGGTSWVGGGSWAAGSAATDRGRQGAEVGKGAQGGDSVAPSFGELLGQIRERVLQVLEHQAVTFRMIAAEVLSHPDLAKAALVQAYFNFLQPGVNCSPEEVTLGPPSGVRGKGTVPCGTGGEGCAPGSGVGGEGGEGEEAVRLTYDNDLSWVNEGRAALTPLSLTLRVRSDGSIRARMVYQADTLEAHLVEAMAFQYKMILERAVGEEGLLSSK